MDQDYQLPAGMHVFQRGWLSSNNVLFAGPGDTALVDSGYVTHAAQTLALVRHALGPQRKLDRLLTTHLHSDHCGGHALLQREFGARVAVPAPDLARVQAWDEDALSYRATGQQCPRFRADEAIAPGAELQLGGQRWLALAAPGHEPHSLVFFCPAEGIVISADALWENGFGVIFPELQGEPGFAEARATLELIGSLDARLAIPGHGRIFGDVKGAVARALARVDYLAADPVRNAQNAVKVILKFLLLERQQMPLAEVEELFRSTPLFVAARERFFKQDAAELAEWVVWALRRAGVAKVEEGLLINRDF
jgi:glyoxylase-like metal-dependent hydrolase (beta-lactamase superfamily II)